MRRLLLVTALIIAVVGVASAQEFAKMDKSVMDAAYYPDGAPKRVFAKSDEARAAKEPKIRILYSRPAKKGRTVFGELLKFGEAWRVGANESTEALFMTDVMFGDQLIEAGRYSIIAVPQADSWKVLLSNDLDGWGEYSHRDRHEVASVTVPTQMSDDVIENLSIALYEKSANVVHIKIGWDKTIVEVPVTLK